MSRSSNQGPMNSVCVNRGCNGKGSSLRHRSIQLPKTTREHTVPSVLHRAELNMLVTFKHTTTHSHWEQPSTAIKKWRKAINSDTRTEEKVKDRVTEKGNTEQRRKRERKRITAGLNRVQRVSDSGELCWNLSALSFSRPR